MGEGGERMWGEGVWERGGGDNSLCTTTPF